MDKLPQLRAKAATFRRRGNDDVYQERPILVVVQLSGGNDGINTVVPYGDPHYYDERPSLGIPAEQVLDLDGHAGFHPSMGPMKELYDQGNVAVIQGIGFPNCNRSHFRSMDVWHTCEPDILATEGWLGRTIRDIDPNKENVLTGVNFGRGLPHALALPGVPVASVGNLATYGLLTGIEDEGANDGAGHLQPHLLTDPGRHLHIRLPVPDGNGRLQGCGHPEDGAGQV